MKLAVVLKPPITSFGFSDTKEISVSILSIIQEEHFKMFDCLVGTPPNALALKICLQRTDRWSVKGVEVIPHVCLSKCLVRGAPLQCVRAH